MSLTVFICPLNVWGHNAYLRKSFTAVQLLVLSVFSSTYVFPNVTLIIRLKKKVMKISTYLRFYLKTT